MSRVCGRCNINEAVNSKGVPRCSDCKARNAKETRKKLTDKYAKIAIESPRVRVCTSCEKEFETLHKRKCPKCCYRDHRATLVEVECPECLGPMKNASSPRCRSCAAKRRGGPERTYTRSKYRQNTAGYVLESNPEHPRSHSGGYVLEHILVMEEHLGRYLYPGENVHHKNGIRSDNRIENLELWVKAQPSGQRVEDLVEFAKQILERYGNE